MCDKCGCLVDELADGIDILVDHAEPLINSADLGVHTIESIEGLCEELVLGVDEEHLRLPSSDLGKLFGVDRQAIRCIPRGFVDLGDRLPDVGAPRGGGEGRGAERRRAATERQVADGIVEYELPYLRRTASTRCCPTRLLRQRVDLHFEPSERIDDDGL